MKDGLVLKQTIKGCGDIPDHEVEVRCSSSVTIYQLANVLEVFLLGCGFSQENINKILVESEYNGN